MTGLQLTIIDKKPDNKAHPFIPAVLDPGKPLEQKRCKATEQTRKCHMKYIWKLLESLEVPFCQDLDMEIECNDGEGAL
jgi:hypothetical protein